MAKRKVGSQFDSQALKVRNFPDFLAYKWCATYCCKALDKGYNVFLDLTSIGGLQKKLWASKVIRIPLSRILGLQLGSPGTK